MYIFINEHKLLVINKYFKKLKNKIKKSCYDKWINVFEIYLKKMFSTIFSYFLERK